ncbi:MAG: hypothetical protein DMF61_07785 [Blastocatellia bacterium AA13]|nr:MAG: hypothetical protein DMF61_07785 [Blastocatellia bacterium AA13]
MSEIKDKESRNVAVESQTIPSSSRRTRRRFLGDVGGIAAASVAAGAIGMEPLFSSRVTVEAAEIAPDDDHKRVNDAEKLRKDAAQDEKHLGAFPHPTNGDEELYPNRIGNFHKTLPHDSITGEVDQAAYNTMLHALSTGSFADFEAVPRLPGANGRLANPLGGLAFNMDGPDSRAVPIGPIPPPIASAGGAAEVVELYWEAYLRDVPLADYNTSNAIVMQACAELSSLADFQGPKIGGQVTPQTLFRYPYAGCTDGPMVSQFLYRNFTVDGIPVQPVPTSQLPAIIWNPDGTFNSFGPGMDFLTSFNEWLAVENGFANPAPATSTTDGPLFMHSVRDIAQLANSDNINSVYIRASNVMGGLGGVANGPYRTSVRQSSFSSAGGGGYLSSLLGNVHKGERHSWFTKWQLHRHLRPEAFGGLVDRRMQGVTGYNLHSQLLNSQILQLIAPYNQHLNNVKFGSNETTFLLPQAGRGGSPSHPSASAGHAFTAGACVTLLKYWFADAPIPQGSLSNTVPKKPNRAGTALQNYVYGVDGPQLTVHGELNKVCMNLSEGRNMLGFHYRVSDNYSGNQQGEAVAIRLLTELKPTYPEPDFTVTFNKFDGTPVTI